QMSRRLLPVRFRAFERASRDAILEARQRGADVIGIAGWRSSGRIARWTRVGHVRAGDAAFQTAGSHRVFVFVFVVRTLGTRPLDAVLEAAQLRGDVDLVALGRVAVFALGPEVGYPCTRDPPWQLITHGGSGRGRRRRRRRR